MKIEGMVDKKTRKKEEEMGNNFVLVSLEENKGKKIVEAINNDTSRKILDALSKKEHTESELSKALNIPMSTIHYNIKQLMEANLVIVDEFHYSSKGKEVNHYKLANKYIIIAPKNSDNKFMEALNKILPLGIITVATSGLLFGYNYFTSSSTQQTAEAAPMMMKIAVEDASMMAGSEPVQEITRPFLNSEMIAWFIVGALSVTLIYFVYELVRKKK